jgi:hypothetical protein
MAKTITTTVPITTEEGQKIVSLEAMVSDETITHEGTEYFLVKHTGSGHRYLAEQSVIDSIENSELDQQMDDLATEEGM